MVSSHHFHLRFWVACQFTYSFLNNLGLINLCHHSWFPKVVVLPSNSLHLTLTPSDHWEPYDASGLNLGYIICRHLYSCFAVDSTGVFFHISIDPESSCELERTKEALGCKRLSGKVDMKIRTWFKFILHPHWSLCPNPFWSNVPLFYTSLELRS